MDERAISLASDEYLRELGIVAQGDILSLRAFATGELNTKPSADCSEEGRGESREQRKKMLIEKLVLGRKKGSASVIKEKKAKVMEGALPKVKTRKVKLAWQHYNEVTQRYVMVRESTGGGQREMSISVTADIPEILTILIDLFFPNGSSSRGQSSEMDFHIGNFKSEVICENDFSLGSYISTNKLSKPRLYLLSKLKGNPIDLNNFSAKDDMVLNQSASTQKQESQFIHVQDCSDKDEDDVMLYQPVFASTPKQEGDDQCVQLHVQDCQDHSDHEVIFKGYGFVDDGSFLLEDTIVDPIELDDSQHGR